GVDVLGVLVRVVGRAAARTVGGAFVGGGARGGAAFLPDGGAGATRGGRVGRGGRGDDPSRRCDRGRAPPGRRAHLVAVGARAQFRWGLRPRRARIDLRRRPPPHRHG